MAKGIDAGVIRRGRNKMKRRKKTAEQIVGEKRFNHEVTRRGVDGFCKWQEDLDAQKEAQGKRDLDNSLDALCKETLGEFSPKFSFSFVSQKQWDTIFHKGERHGNSRT